MKWRVLFSVLVVVGWFIAGSVYNVAQGPVQGSAAIGQLNGGNAEYIAARTVATTDVIPKAINVIGIIALVALWLPPFLRKMRRMPSDEPF